MQDKSWRHFLVTFQSSGNTATVKHDFFNDINLESTGYNMIELTESKLLSPQIVPSFMVEKPIIIDSRMVEYNFRR